MLLFSACACLGNLKHVIVFRRWRNRDQGKDGDLYSQLRGKGHKMPSWFKVNYNLHVTQTFNSQVVKKDRASSC